MRSANRSFATRQPIMCLAVLLLVSFLPLHAAKVTQGHDLYYLCNSNDHSQTVTLFLEDHQDANQFTWVVTAGDDKAKFRDDTGKFVSKITTNIDFVSIYAQKPSEKEDDVAVTVSFANANKVDYKLTVFTPKSLRRIGRVDYGRGKTCDESGKMGYQSLIIYEVTNQFVENAGNVGVNEKFGMTKDDQKNDWPDKPPEGGQDTPNGIFADGVCATGTRKPQPIKPQRPLGNNKVKHIAQTWRAGDSMNPSDGAGCPVQMDELQYFLDHGDNLKATSPLQFDRLLQAQEAQNFSSHQGLARANKRRKELQEPQFVGYPMPLQDVRVLQEQAVVIVKGFVLGVSENSSVASGIPSGALSGSKPMVAHIAVTRVLKGDVPEHELIALAFSQNHNLLPFSVQPGETAILFLNAAQQGIYTFVDPYGGKMPVTSRYVPAPIGATTTELLEAEIVASLDDTDREVARTALEQIGYLGRVSSTVALQNVATAGDPEFRALAYAAMVRLHDYTALDSAIAFAAAPTADERLQQYQLVVAEAVRNIRDPFMVSQLGELLSSENLALRRAAVRALRNIADPSSLGYVASALSDSDADVRYDAMMAMAQMQGFPSDWSPARDVFDKDEATYLQHWQTGWNSQ